MAVLDRELTRGERLVARAEDVNRLTSPLFSIARALFERHRDGARAAHEHEDDRPTNS